MLRVLLLVFFLAALPAAAQLPPACAPYGANCLYQRAALTPYVVSANQFFSYLDATGAVRNYSAVYRQPLVGGAGGFPVVIWVHDGTPAAPVASAMLPAWSDFTAESGYFTVTTGHPARPAAAKPALCAAVGLVSALDCDSFDDAALDRARDLKHLLMNLQTANTTPGSPLYGLLNMQQVAIAGVGRGSSAALSLGGAVQLLTQWARSPQINFADPVPKAFVAVSPTPPQKHNFFDRGSGDNSHSWAGVTRPVLLISGDGDNDCVGFGGCEEGATPSQRRIPFRMLPNGNKYEMYAKTTMLDRATLNEPALAACVGLNPPATCADYIAWLKSSVLAFLDGRVLGKAPANVWLTAGLIGPASGNVVSWRSATPPLPAGPACPPAFPSCLYPAPITTNVAPDNRQFTYYDDAGLPRTVRFSVRWTAAGQLPVVVWVHGGADGRTISQTVLTEWSSATANAGYIAVTPAFPDRTAAEKAALCFHLGVVADCAKLNSPSWDRNFDIKWLLNYLTWLNAQPGPLNNKFDLSKIIVAGYSAGSNASVSVAGAAKQIGSTRWYNFSDGRPVAFVAISPAGPGHGYMFDSQTADPSTSFDGITRPLLYITSTGDEAAGDPSGNRLGQYPQSRPGAFDRTPGGSNNKYQLIIEDHRLGHDFFAGSTIPFPPPAGWAAAKPSMVSAVFAFFDAYARSNAAALGYLQQNYLRSAYPGVNRWEVK